MREKSDAEKQIDARLAEDPSRRLVLTRRFTVGLDALFDAWTNPAIAAKWLFTGPTSESHKTQMDVRVGGKWTITDRRGGTDYTALGEYVEVRRPHRLIFTFGMPVFSEEFDRIIVDIAPHDDGCIMTMTQEGLAPEAKAPSEEGWGWMFKGLEAALAG
jgi:uncharacterized protein YndB with AHSA1/START domain